MVDNVGVGVTDVVAQVARELFELRLVCVLALNVRFKLQT